MNYLKQHNEVLTWHVKLEWLITHKRKYCVGKGIVQLIKESPESELNPTLSLETFESWVQKLTGRT